MLKKNNIIIVSIMLLLFLLIKAKTIHAKSNSSIIYVTTMDELKQALSIDENTISIDNDIIVCEIIYFSGTHIINGNGYTITGDSVDNVAIFAANAKCEVNDLNFTNSLNTVVKIAGNVVFNNCEASKSWGNDGFAPMEKAQVVFNNCKAFDNYDEGISTHNKSYAEVWGGEYYRNGYKVGTKEKGAKSSFGGVHIGGGRMGKVQNVYSHDNCTYGISFINFQEIDMDDHEICNGNTVANNGADGIFVTSCSDIKMCNNIVYSNGGYGIHFGLDETYKPPEGVNVGSNGYVTDNTVRNNVCGTIKYDTPDLLLEFNTNDSLSKDEMLNEQKTKNKYIFAAIGAQTLIIFFSLVRMQISVKKYTVLLSNKFE